MIYSFEQTQEKRKSTPFGRTNSRERDNFDSSLMYLGVSTEETDTRDRNSTTTVGRTKSHIELSTALVHACAWEFAATLHESKKIIPSSKKNVPSRVTLQLQEIDNTPSGGDGR